MIGSGERLERSSDDPVAAARLRTLARGERLAEVDNRNSQLAKADLASQVVREFPMLQGVVGKYYARDSHEAEAVAHAIEEQYLPQGDRRPQTVIGAALALLDKYDTLSGYFGLG
ncbi:MAG: glycine--tRNA ligase subunit beta, partial [Gemmatimonadetes bacterium]|nr:glycine--tRNA ligase subunit beta [Gemmatimonadota bacterium]